MTLEVIPLLADGKMESLDKGKGNGSSLGLYGTSWVVTMGGSDLAHPHFRMVAETGGAIAEHRDQRSSVTRKVFPVPNASQFARHNFELHCFWTKVLPAGVH
jgi:hypothetical protein